MESRWMQLCRISVAGIFVLFFSCNTKKQAVKDETFIVEGYFQKQPLSTDSPEGVRLTFIFKSGYSQSLDSVYFRGKSQTIEKVSDMPLVFTTFFPKEKPDRMLDANLLLESNNIPPTLNRGLSFDLQPDQAVLVYRRSGKMNYIKVDLKEKPFIEAQDTVTQNN